MQLQFSNYLVLVFMGMLEMACTPGQLSNQVSLNPTMQEDKAYYKSYTKFNRRQTLYKNFDTEFSISTTLLSPDFRSAFSSRYRSLFASEKPFLEESNQKLGFFVTLYNPKQTKHELDVEGVWNISAKLDGRVHKPLLLKQLSDKARWKPFFEHISPWSSEYLVVFDVPYERPSEQLSKNPELTLTIANAAAKINFRWN